MSCGESRAVSIHRRHRFCPHRGQSRQLEIERLPVSIQDHVRRATASFRISALSARLCEDSLQSGWSSLTPCQALFASRRSWLRVTRWRSGSTSRRTPARVEQRHEPMHVRMLRQPASSRTSWSRCPGNRRCCCRAACGAPRRPSGSSAHPAKASCTVRKFFTCRFRSFSTAGSSVGPSTPQFQLRLSFAPSRLFSPFASLCFWLYETRSLSVKPS